MRCPYPKALAGLLACAPLPALAAPQPGPVAVFDRTVVPRAEGPWIGAGGRTPVTWVLARSHPLRLAGGPRALPLAWRVVAGSTSSEEVVVSEELSARLTAALRPAPPARGVAEALVRRAFEAGEAWLLADPDTQDWILELDPGPPVRPGASAAEITRALTRGNVRDRWSVSPEARARLAGEDGLGAEAAPDDVPDRVIQLDVVGLGVHLAPSTYPLPAPLAHVTVRARCHDIATGERRWERVVMLGAVLPDVEPGTFLLALADLERAAADRLASDWWPELVARPEPPGLPLAATRPAGETAPGASGPEAPAVAPGAVDLPVGTPAVDGPARLRTLLAELARRRVPGYASGDPWRALRLAAEPSWSPGMVLAVHIAEDPLASLADLASRRLDVGLAEAHARVERSRAFRRTLGEDLLREVARASPGDWRLEKAVRFLLQQAEGGARLPDEARRSAEPLLMSARARGGSRTPEGLALLLLGARIWPEGAASTLARDLETAP